MFSALRNDSEPSAERNVIWSEHVCYEGTSVKSRFARFLLCFGFETNAEGGLYETKLCLFLKFLVGDSLD